MKILALWLLSFLAIPCPAQDKRVCITFDDLPVAASRFRSNASPGTVTAKLLSTLKRHKIPAIGFVNEGKLYVLGEPDSPRINLLRMWLESGFDLGNHTFSHMDYHNVESKEYFDDIIKGEKIIRPLMISYGKSLKFFRHPFLHSGESRGKADSLRAFLNSKGYREAPVTIDNSDWIFSLAYDSAMVTGDSALMKSVGTAYVSYMEKKTTYYENQSMKLFGRAMRHILLLHANTINADHLDELAAMYESNNYRFVSLTEALEDEAYLTEVTVFNRNWGISWLDRWALSIGKKGTFFKDEPLTPEYVMKLAGVVHE